MAGLPYTRTSSNYLYVYIFYYDITVLTRRVKSPFELKKIGGDSLLYSRFQHLPPTDFAFQNLVDPV